MSSKIFIFVTNGKKIGYKNLKIKTNRNMCMDIACEVIFEQTNSKVGIKKYRETTVAAKLK